MELRVLRYFLTAAEEGNITHAADILHITQPTLSRQLTDLEKELGTTLMIRGKRSLVLTNDGLLFKRHAQEIIELADRTEQEFINRNAFVNGIISVGATEAVGSHILADLIKQYNKKYPNVRFDLYNEMADNVKYRLDKGLADIGLLLMPVDLSNYEFIRLPQKETWGVLVHKNNPLSKLKTVTAKDIIPYPLILPSRKKVYTQILEWLGCSESELKIPATYTLLSNVALLVENQMACAICLDGAFSIYYNKNLRFIPFSPEHTTNSVLVWEKNYCFNPATMLFIQMIQEYYS